MQIGVIRQSIRQATETRRDSTEEDRQATNVDVVGAAAEVTGDAEKWRLIVHGRRTRNGEKSKH